MDDCVFCKIIKNEIPSIKVYEDNDICAFKDSNPQAPVHILVVPKKHIEHLTDLKAEDETLIGRIYTVINKIANEQGISDTGFRVVSNCGDDADQTVKHIHFHILGGTKMQGRMG